MKSGTHQVADSTRALESTSALRAWLQMLKPRITAMVAFTAGVGALLAGGRGELWSVLEAVVWITCVAGAATIFNQVLERDTDRLMRRTMLRPLVTGRLRAREAILYGAALAAAGTLGLALRFNTLSALLALATLIGYALVYTPLKRVSTLNTVVGALPGAMPPVLGYAALAGNVHGWAWYLFAVLFAWQFPHFLAIAWLYREDYSRAGLRMLPCVQGGQGMTGRQSLLYALTLLPISLIPTAQHSAGPLFACSALALSLIYAGAALRFALREDQGRARALLVTSLVYLPALFTLALLDPLVRAAGA